MRREERERLRRLTAEEKRRLVDFILLLAEIDRKRRVALASKKEGQRQEKKEKNLSRPIRQSPLKLRRTGRLKLVLANIFEVISNLFILKPA